MIHFCSSFIPVPTLTGFRWQAVCACGWGTAVFDTTDLTVADFVGHVYAMSDQDPNLEATPYVADYSRHTRRLWDRLLGLHRAPALGWPQGTPTTAGISGRCYPISRTTRAR